MRLGAGLRGCVARSTAASMRSRGARLDAVRADDRRADDGLGDRAEHLADPLADQPVGRLQPRLEEPDREEQRQEADVDEQGQLPGPEQHEHRGEQQLRGARPRSAGRPTA